MPIEIAFFELFLAKLTRPREVEVSLLVIKLFPGALPIVCNHMQFATISNLANNINLNGFLNSTLRLFLVRFHENWPALAILGVIFWMEMMLALTSFNLVPHMWWSDEYTASKISFLSPTGNPLRGLSRAELGSSRDVVKRCSRDLKIGMESGFGSISMVEFVRKIPQKIRLPYCSV